VKKLVVPHAQLAYKFFEKFDYSHQSEFEKNYWGEGLDLVLEWGKANK